MGHYRKGCWLGSFACFSLLAGFFRLHSCAFKKICSSRRASLPGSGTASAALAFFSSWAEWSPPVPRHVCGDHGLLPPHSFEPDVGNQTSDLRPLHFLNVYDFTFRFQLLHSADLGSGGDFCMAGGLGSFFPFFSFCVINGIRWLPSEGFHPTDYCTLQIPKPQSPLVFGFFSLFHWLGG